MKQYLALLVSVLPSNAARIFFYRLFFGYRIRNSKLGFGTVIAVKSFEMQGAVIGRFCRFVGPIEVTLQEKANIGHSNQFRCGAWTQDKTAWSYKPCLEVGNNTSITSGHYFDVAATVVLGDRTMIAGTGSQFWTHGPDIGCKDIRIGDDCYIGSAARFCPGSSIGNRIMVGVGSVLTKKMDFDDAVVAGVPAKLIKAQYDWRNKKSLG